MPGGAAFGNALLERVLGQFQSLANASARDLQRLVEQTGGAAANMTENLSVNLNRVLQQMQTSIQGIVQPMQYKIFQRGLQALTMGQNVVGLEMPSKLTGVLSAQQRMEMIADHTTMFLNGFTFGTIDSLRHESAALAHKYGDQVYWAANIAGAATGVIVVIVAAVLAPEAVVLGLK